ncbi:MAG: fumarate hydratase [Oscillospiraceae bacterium]|nr:fumarate hydratase [Oscillospiraceae bacterium]
MLETIRLIEAAQITDVVAQLCVQANTCLGEDIRAALTQAHACETLPLAVNSLDVLLKNADIAQREALPICQDTGMAVVFVRLGEQVHVQGSMTAAIHEGVRRGYRAGYCRNSVVRDPIDRINTGDNTPAVIHVELVPGSELHITVAPKGFGSENMSALRMLNPSDGLDGVKQFVLETAKAAGPNACPPMIIGVGVGGTMEKCALLAKQALLREVGSTHDVSAWAQVEQALLAQINALGIGPAGFGGNTTALAVHIEIYPTHIAGLPVAVNIGCHATRHCSAVL